MSAISDASVEQPPIKRSGYRSILFIKHLKAHASMGVVWMGATYHVFVPKGARIQIFYDLDVVMWDQSKIDRLMYASSRMATVTQSFLIPQHTFIGKYYEELIVKFADFKLGFKIHPEALLLLQPRP